MPILDLPHCRFVWRVRTSDNGHIIKVGLRFFDGTNSSFASRSAARFSVHDVQNIEVQDRAEVRLSELHVSREIPEPVVFYVLNHRHNQISVEQHFRKILIDHMGSGVTWFNFSTVPSQFHVQIWRYLPRSLKNPADQLMCVDEDSFKPSTGVANN